MFSSYPYKSGHRNDNITFEVYRGHLHVFAPLMLKAFGRTTHNLGSELNRGLYRITVVTIVPEFPSHLPFVLGEARANDLYICVVN